MPDKIDKTLHITKVFQDEKGIYFEKKIERFAFIMTNLNGKAVYSENPTEVRIEKVRPQELGYTKSKKKTVYVRKRLSSDQSLTDTMIYFELPLEFFVPENDPRYTHLWINEARSGQVFFTDFNCAIPYSANINDPNFCRKGKAKRLPDDYLLPRNVPIYEQGSDGTLELYVEISGNYE